MTEIFNQIKKINFNSPLKLGIARKSVVYKSFLNMVKNLRIIFRFLRCKKATLDLIFSQFILASFLVTILKILFFQFFQTHKVLLFLILIIIISFAIKFNFREALAQHLRNIYYHVDLNFFQGFFFKIPRLCIITGYSNIDFLLCFFVHWVWRFALLLRFLIDSNSYIRTLYITFIFVATLVPNINVLVLILSFILSLAQLILYVNIFTYTKLYKNYIIYDATEVMNLKICKSNLALFYSIFILLLQDKVKDENGVLNQERKIHINNVNFYVSNLVAVGNENGVWVNYKSEITEKKKNNYPENSLPFIFLESKNKINLIPYLFFEIELISVIIFTPQKINQSGEIIKIQSYSQWAIRKDFLSPFQYNKLKHAYNHPQKPYLKIQI